MSVQGVSTRKVKAITEELCGYRFVRFQDLGEQQGLNQALARFAGASWMSRIRISSWMLAIERVREASIIRTRAVLIAIRVTWDGHRQRCSPPNSPFARARPSLAGFVPAKHFEGTFRPAYGFKDLRASKERYWSELSLQGSLDAIGGVKQSHPGVGDL
jgi:hypothetical protein